MKIKLTPEELDALEYVRIFMEECHLERALPADLQAVASRGMNVVDKILVAMGRPKTSRGDR